MALLWSSSFRSSSLVHKFAEALAACFVCNYLYVPTIVGCQGLLPPVSFFVVQLSYAGVMKSYQFCLLRLFSPLISWSWLIIPFTKLTFAFLFSVAASALLYLICCPFSQVDCSVFSIIGCKFYSIAWCVASSHKLHLSLLFCSSLLVMNNKLPHFHIIITQLITQGQTSFGKGIINSKYSYINNRLFALQPKLC